jgi:hypothetical protein
MLTPLLALLGLFALVRRCTLAVLLLGGSALASLNWTRRITRVSTTPDPFRPATSGSCMLTPALSLAGDDYFDAGLLLALLGLFALVRRCTLAVLLLGGSALASLNWTRE